MVKKYVLFEYPKSKVTRIKKGSVIDNYFSQNSEQTKWKNGIVLPNSWIEVNLSGLKKNLSIFHKYMNEKCSVIAIVKCDAYGHGLIPVARELAKLGVSKLGVATLSDVIEIRSARIDTSLILLYPFLKEHLYLLIRNNVELTISNIDNLISVIDYAKSNLSTKIIIHISFSIGIDSEGLDFSEISEHLPSLLSTNNIIIEGVCGVLSNENASKKAIDIQITKFKDVLKKMYDMGVVVKSVHIANSESTDLNPNCLKSIKNIDPKITIYVRLGRWLYGTYFTRRRKIHNELSPVVHTIISRVIQIKKLEPNKSVGYFGSYKTRMTENIGTIPFGWGSSGVLLKDTNIYLKDNILHQVGVMSANALHFKASSTIKVGDRASLIDLSTLNNRKLLNLEKAAETFISQVIISMGAKLPRVYFYET